MKEEKQKKDPDALDMEMKRLIRKLHSENDALNKILKLADQINNKSQPDPGAVENEKKNTANKSKP
jgi:hypothetical protein